MPPDAFGPFRVLHQIGVGTLGPVFRAYDQQQERLVAVKLFRLDLTPDRVTQLVAGLQRLIDAHLVHPAVASPIATGIVDRSAYLVQDFVGSDSLDVIIREFGPVPPDEAARVALQLAGALDYAAAANVWHGSLHPHDVFLASDDVRLTGLGIAQALEQVMTPATFRRPYGAPERIAGAAWDRRADVFGLAVVIAEMIAGRRLSSAGSRAVQGLLGEAGVEADALREVFTKALSEDPKQRFDTALAFAKALRRATRGPIGEAPARRVLLPETVAEQQLPLANPAAFVPELSVVDDAIVADRADGLSDFAPVASAPDPGPDLHVPQRAQHPPAQAHPRIDDRAVAEQMKDIDNLILNLSPAPAPTGATETETETMAEVRLMPPASPPRPNGDGPARAAAVVADAPLKRPAAPAQAPPRPIESRSQSAVWPLALALLVGLIVGIAVGFYVFADRAGRNVDGLAQADGPAVSGPAIEPPSSGAPVAGTPSPNAAGSNAPAAAAGSTTSAPAATPGSSHPSSGDGAAPASEAVPPRGHRAPPASSELSGGGRPVEHPADRTPSARPDRSVTRPSIAAETAAAAASTEAAGRVLVRSSPAGARVVLDGREVGMTPVTVRALSFGTHLVRVTRDGYVDDERRVSVSAKRPAQSLIVELSRARETKVDASEGGAARFTAALVVESRPPGAVVYLNGERVGTTPLTLDTVATGSQALRLEMDGYRRWTSSVRVVAGERNRITASLEQ
jgi:hypothetical protein